MPKKSPESTPKPALSEAIERSGATMRTVWHNPLQWKPDSTAHIMIDFPTNDMRYAFILKAHSEVERPSVKKGPLPRQNFGFARGGRSGDINLNYLNDGVGLTVLIQEPYVKHEYNQQVIETFIAKNLLGILDEAELTQHEEEAEF